MIAQHSPRRAEERATVALLLYHHELHRRADDAGQRTTDEAGAHLLRRAQLAALAAGDRFRHGGGQRELVRARARTRAKTRARARAVLADHAHACAPVSTLMLATDIRRPR